MTAVSYSKRFFNGIFACVFLLKTAAVFVLPFISVASVLSAVPVAFAGEAGSDEALYVVKNIKADKTDKTATAARDKAISEAKVTAYKTVIARITLPEEAKTLPLPSVAKLSDLVAEMAVTGEKTSSVRYIASFDITFNPKAVKAYLEENGVSYITATAMPQLFLPIYKTDAEVLLFDERNTWLGFLQNNQAEVTALPLIVPFGDSLDKEQTDALLQGIYDNDTVANLKYRYNVSDLVIAEAQETKDGKRYAFSVYSLNENGEPATAPFHFSVSKNSSAERIFNAAFKTIKTKLENDWKQNNVVHFSSASVITAIVPMEKMANWIAVKQRLDTVSIIDHYDLKAMKSDRIQLNIFFGRGIDRLVSELEGAGLILQQAPSGIWALYERDNKRIIPMLTSTYDNDLPADEAEPVAANAEAVEKGLNP